MNDFASVFPPPSMPVAQIIKELRHAAPFLGVMKHQINGSLKDTENGVLALMSYMTEMHEIAMRQLKTVKSLVASDEAIDGVSRQEALESVRQDNQALTKILTSALGSMQFHDIMRQRVEHVGASMDELDQHLQNIADQLEYDECEEDLSISLKDRLDSQAGRYVMHSQRVMHHTVTGDALPVIAVSSSSASIELF